uniref:Uncharacterized protein n=1 Tax=Megaselia scalaris TaxID=36166 RepID=T1GZR1_MEGSC
MPTQKVFSTIPFGDRRPGRPKQRWLKLMEDDVKFCLRAGHLSKNCTVKELCDIDICQKFHKFRKLPINYSNVKPKVLLRVSHSPYSFANSVEEKYCLIASKTKLGWTIYVSTKCDESLTNLESLNETCHIRKDSIINRIPLFDFPNDFQNDESDPTLHPTSAKTMYTKNSNTILTQKEPDFRAHKTL